MIATLLAFSAVIILIVDLDRPQEGFVKVSQQAMLDLQTRLRSHVPDLIYMWARRLTAEPVRRTSRRRSRRHP